MPFHRLLSAFRRGHKSSTELEQMAIEAIEEGNALEEEGRHKEASHCYEKAINLAPKLPRAYLNWGNSLLELDDIEEALTAYDKALDLDPRYAVAHFNKGNALFRSGEKAMALRAYEQAVFLKPNFVDALVAMGVLNEATGQWERALDNYQRALAINPDYAEVHFNLGGLLQSLGRTVDAIESFNHAIRLNSTYVAGYIALGNVLSEAGQHERAIDSFQKALRIAPNNFLAENNMGNSQLKLERVAEASASYKRALQINPDFVEAHNNLGNALRRQGSIESALASYRKALKIKPNYPEANVNLGNALKGIGDFQGAISCYRTALAINPQLAEAHVNLGNALKDVGQLTEAIESYEIGMSIRPDFVEALNNLGVALKDIGKLKRAVECFRNAIEIQPSFVEAYCNLGVALKEMGDIQGALTSLERVLEIKPDYADAYSILLFLEHYHCARSNVLSVERARRFGELVAKQSGTKPLLNNTPVPDRCLRIGLVSGDFVNHPVGYFLEGVLSSLHSKTSRQLEIVAYSTDFRADAVTTRIQIHCDGWHVVAGLSDEKFVDKIHQDKIDILIDLSGHTTHNRLSAFAWRPAPVQATWLGYFATTGVEAMDYLIADRWTLPESEEHNFVEKIWRLPDTRLCFTPPPGDTEVGELPALRNGHVTFGCFNHLSKINDEVLRRWASILAAVPESRLYLKATQLGEIAIRKSTQQRFLANGIDPSRLILEGPSSREIYLSCYREVDIALDPFPFTGGTTTAEALWMGVPVLTIAGQSLLERQGVGLLANADLLEWIAEDGDDYVVRAISYAANTESLTSLRHGLRQKVLASPIFNAQLFANNFEAALREMWKKWCHDHPNQSNDRAKLPISSLTV